MWISTTIKVRCLFRSNPLIFLNWLVPHIFCARRIINFMHRCTRFEVNFFPYEYLWVLLPLLVIGILINHLILVPVLLFIGIVTKFTLIIKTWWPRMLPITIKIIDSIIINVRFLLIIELLEFLFHLLYYLSFIVRTHDIFAPKILTV